eukprot:9823296-Heterocapsa_arctica.AAC.1
MSSYPELREAIQTFITRGLCFDADGEFINGQNMELDTIKGKGKGGSQLWRKAPVVGQRQQ